MSNTDALYSELKGDLQTVSEPLFDFACKQVEKRGAFLPMGATLSPGGEVAMVAAAPEDDLTTSEIVLPLLMEATQQSAGTAKAVAICEWVKITLAGQKPTDAVKVQAHHQRGLAVAFYIPATKKFLRGWQFGEMIVKSAAGLIEAWPCE